MQYLLAIYEDDSIYGEDGQNQVWADIIQAHTAFGEALVKAGVMRGGEGLARESTATTIRKRGQDVMVHDGPHIETKEQLGGFYIIEVDTLDQALDWAKKVPLSADGAVEVRPTVGPA